MKKLFSVLLCCMLLLAVLPIGAKASTVIDTVKVTGLGYPTNGKSMPTEATMGGAGYSLHSIDWFDKTADRFLEPGEKAVSGHEYEAVIWLEADDGYVFKSVNDYTHDLNCFVNGHWVQPIKAYEYKAFAMVELRLTFPEVPFLDWISAIDLKPTAPEVDKPLTYYFIGGIQYKGVVRPGAENYAKDGSSWWIARNPVMLGNNTFQPGTTYRYYATLVTQPGYAFTMEPKVTVNGQQAEYSYEYEDGIGQIMCVNYLYPTLPDFHYTDSVDLVIPAPKANGTPDFTRIDNAQYESVNPATNASGYSNGIRWTDANGNNVTKFRDGEVYMVQISLKAKEGYRFAANTTPTVNGQAPFFFSVGTTGQTLTLTYAFPKIEQDHTHVLSDWGGDDLCHYKYCTICNTYLIEDEHVGGKATCNVQAVCTICGLAYGELSPVHTPESKWTAAGEEGHGHRCTICNEVVDLQPHTPGPEATQTQAQKCTECGYVLALAEGHTHRLSKVERIEPTCSMQGQVEHYACDGCNLYFADAEGEHIIEDVDLPIPPAGHIATDEWHYDEYCHWKACTVCGLELDEAKLPHEPVDGICSICGGEAAEIPLPPETGGTGDTEEWVVPVIIAFAATSVCTVGAGAIYLWKKKK